MTSRIINGNPTPQNFSGEDPFYRNMPISKAMDCVSLVEAGRYHRMPSPIAGAEVSLASLETAILEKNPMKFVVFLYGGQVPVTIGFEEWLEISKPLQNISNSPDEELAALSESVAAFENLVVRRAGAGVDIGGWPGNVLAQCFPMAQQNCFQERDTTSQFLFALELAGLLHFHKVGPAVFNSIGNHTANGLIDNESNQKYVVDTWVNDGGEEPVILPYSLWAEKDWR